MASAAAIRADEGVEVLDVRRLNRRYGAMQVLEDLSFSVARGEFVCIVGPSGCGKTTLLRCLSGLLEADGEVILAGKRITRPPAEMALVFQDYRASLMPWLSVAKNVALPLRNKGLAKAEIGQRVQEALASVSLEGFFDHYPWQLSGGMQQRVAIARALAYRPEILLMDEPFASVDAQTRNDLEDLILGIHRKLGMTTVLVTHDVDEAVFLGDRVIVLSARPTVVKEEVVIDLPAVRDQVKTKELPAFAQRRAHILSAVRGKTIRSAAGQR